MSWQKAVGDTVQKVVAAGASEGAKTIAKDQAGKFLKGESPFNPDEVVKTVAKVAGVGDVDLWGQAIGAARQYMDTVGGPVKQRVLEGLTTTAKEAGEYPAYARNPGSDRFRNERSVGDPYEVTEGNKWKGWDQRFRKDESDRPDWVQSWGIPGAKSAYENPLQAAELAGTATAAGTAILGGGALNWWAEGSKPRSSYAAPVEPYRGGYNPSVESAQMAAKYKHELEEQKFEHKMALMDAREQARVPGGQSTSVGAYGSGDVQGLLSQLQSSRPSYF